MSQTKKKVLIFIDWFLPGIKAGGPINSVSAIVNQLSTEFNFYVLTFCSIVFSLPKIRIFGKKIFSSNQTSKAK